MSYQRVSLEVVVNTDDAATSKRALNDALDRLEQQITVFASEIQVRGTDEPDASEKAVVVN